MNTKKKNDYKKKEQKFPLRNKQQNQIEPSPPSNRPANRKLAGSQVTKPANRKTERNVGNKKKTPEMADTVVLTQKEFDAILDTIGQLALEAERGTDVQTKPSSDQVDPGVSIELSAADGVSYTGADRESLAVAKDLPPSPSPELALAKELPPSPIPGSKPPIPPHSMSRTQQAAPEPSFTNVPQVAAPSRRGNVHTSMDKPLTEVLDNMRGVPTAHLTMAEKKRLQWEREKVEDQKLVAQDPWGRPGAGAPIKDTSGKVLTDYKTRAPDTPPPGQVVDYSIPTPMQNRITQSKGPQAATYAQTVPVTTTTTTSRGGMNTASPAMAVTSAVTSGGLPPPAAIRSSIIIGQAEPNENRFESAKERQRKQWLADLEQQREEQRQRKLGEKNVKQEGETYDKWADHFSTYTPAGLPQQQQQPQPQELGGTIERVSSAPVAAAPPHVSPREHEPRTHIRGQNLHMDSKMAQEIDEKRRKHLEHQEYIKQQIEEKERLKRAEKERMMREEQAEEDRMRRERERMEGQLLQEKERARAKEDTERQRLESLRHAMEEAQMVAEIDKHAKRVLKLQRAGHDTSHLNANFEAKLTPRAVTSTSNIPGYSPRDLDQSITEPTPRHDLDQSTRTLTPTKFRQMGGSEPNSPRREFGIQTDTDLGMQLGLPYSRESTDIVYKGPIEKPQKKKPKKKKVPTATLR